MDTLEDGLPATFPEMRKVERHIDRDEWEETALALIKQWDVFRMFEPDGTKVLGLLGSEWFIAMEDGYVRPNGIATVFMREYDYISMEDFAMYLEGWRERKANGTI